jgi:hypothetical protein
MSVCLVLRVSLILLISFFVSYNEESCRTQLMNQTYIGFRSSKNGAGDWMVSGSYDDPANIAPSNINFILKFWNSNRPCSPFYALEAGP